MSQNNSLAKKHGEAQASTTEYLYSVGDKLAKREEYKNLNGIEAVYFYLVQKHHWLPSQVRSLNVDDLSFCLEEEKL